MVVEEEAKAHQPGGPLLRRMRQHEAHGPDDVGRCIEQNLTLDQRLAHEPEFVVFEIAQSAVDELAGSRGCPLGQIVLLAQDHREAAARRIARDARTIDAAPDDDEIDRLQLLHGERPVSTC